MSGHLYQHSTLGALTAGLFEGSLSIDELLSHGDSGIGTLNGLDGELVILEGRAYQVDWKGSVKEVGGNEQTPYAAVTFFEPDHTLDIQTRQSKAELETDLKHHFSSLNVFQTIQVRGTFGLMRCRSVAKQEQPYPTLAEAANTQAEFTRQPVTGTLIGFYAPELFGGAAVPGFHWHFLNDDRDFGGHVLDFSVDSGRLEWQEMDTLEQHFPVTNQRFMETSIELESSQAQIEEAEH